VETQARESTPFLLSFADWAYNIPASHDNEHWQCNGGGMANEEHLKILRQGVEAWNKWRKENPEIRPNLGGANLSRENLHEADLSRSSLLRARLRWADLSWAKLRGADLRWADFHCADLSGVNLNGAYLNWANLNEANLDHAKVGYTNFGDVDLSGVKGLASVRHIGPSTIGIDSVYRSKGKIPEVFLRGCGIPDTMIAYIGSLVGQPIQYYSCFISYSSQDHECAERLHADLQSKGVRCWFAPEDLKIGDKFRTRIDEAIRVYDKLLLILSGHSIQSDWVESEVEAAFEKERKHKRTVLFPVCLDDAVMETDQAWAADIRRTRHIGDFSGWENHDTYQKQFARLLRDLQAVDAQEVVAPTVARPPKAKTTPTETYRTKLRRNLIEHFNLSELRDLCFDMNVDYESLTGENKADKARELVAYCERIQIIPDLVAKCKELRPKVSWEGEIQWLPNCCNPASIGDDSRGNGIAERVACITVVAPAYLLRHRSAWIAPR
jgi:hypothetical protein